MGKILTIGIPVYNMEKYLERCLDSVTGIPNLEDVEIIVVNDGSKDRSLEIAKTYEHRFPTSVKVIDKPNGGWGSGINRSIKEATGTYFKSLDSDDWFDTNQLSKFVDVLKNITADLVLSALNEVNEHGDIINTRAYDTEFTDKVFGFGQFLKETTLCGPIHAITYRTNLLRDNNFLVWEKFYGDLDYISTPLEHVRTIYQTNLNIYQYFIGREGQSISIEGYRKHLDDYLAVARKAIKLDSARADITSQELRAILWQTVKERALWPYKLLLQQNYLGKEPYAQAKLKEFDSFIKTNHPRLYKAIATERLKGFIPYILLWRHLGFNIYRLR